MRRMRVTVWVLLVMVTLAGLPAVSWAQAAVTQADVNRLEGATAEIDKQVGVLKKSDPTLAAEVEQSLTLLKEDVIFMRVTLRRGGAVNRDIYTQVRDRIETLRIKSLGQKVTAQPVIDDEPTTPRVWTVPVGTELDVRLQTALNSATAKIEQRFEATTLIDLNMGGHVIIPAGTVVRGFVGSVRRASRVERRGSMTLAFDEILLARGPARLRASVTQALDGKLSDDASRVGTGAVIGGILGGLLGGGKGMLVGVLVGGGGTIAATEGADVDLPVGTILRLRIDSPLEVR
jgi:hypothetical protein